MVLNGRFVLMMFILTEVNVAAQSMLIG